MIKVLMVCHGNICRSPMAEFLLKDMVAKRGIASQFDIASAATSREEIGNPVHHGTRKKLAQFGISVAGKTARQMTRRDYENYDYIIAMDRNNLRNITASLAVMNITRLACSLTLQVGSDKASLTLGTLAILILLMTISSKAWMVFLNI